MKDPHLTEEEHADPRSFPFANVRPKRHKQRLNIGPSDRTADGMGEDQFQRGFMTLFHVRWYY